MAFGVYIHWPYCKSKCPYCDFNSHVAESVEHEVWADAYVRELEHWHGLTAGQKATSIFFGGGTPSLMKPETVARVIEAVAARWGLSADCEITLEANPTSYETEKFKVFRDAGINRVSIGVQSLRADQLAFLGREHSPEQAVTAIKSASQLFDRFSFDLIYARPQQSLAEWRYELKDALALAGDHMSLYQLTIEQGTPFYTRHARGEFQIPEQDLAADFYDVTWDVMDKEGLPAYEVSNHARSGAESRHNLVYWRYDDYVGVGPGAHGRYTRAGKKYAVRAHRAPDIWLKQVNEKGDGLHPVEELSPRAQCQEALMMGGRLHEGVPYERLKKLWGDDLEGFIPAAKIRHLIQMGILEDDPQTLRTTLHGFKCLNAVLGFLLAA